MQVITPYPWERAAFIGKTRTGKTTLAIKCLRAMPNVIVVDTKLREDFSEILIGGGGLQFHDEDEALPGECWGEEIYAATTGRYVWHTPHSFTLDADERDRFFRWAYLNGGRVIYVDEINDIAPGPLSFPKGYHLCQTRGGSAGIGMWGSTQRPSGVPRWTLSEAEHVYCFRLRLADDRKRMEEEAFEQPAPWSKITGHKFIHVGPSKRLHGPWKLDLTEDSQEALAS